MRLHSVMHNARRMARTSNLDTADAATSGAVRKSVEAWRTDGHSWERIARLLHDRHNIDVSSATVRRWLMDEPAVA